MKCRTALARMSLLVLGLFAAAASHAAEDPLVRIKKLAGTWYAVDDQGRPTAQVAATFRVTSNGHAVVETMFPGSANEMINVYYRDVDRVLMSHYCAGGNQPVLELKNTAAADTVALEFVDISNMLTIDDEHMHEGRYQWVGNDRIKTEWRSFTRGKYSGTMRFEWVRRP